MPTKWCYEALMVHQFKDNDYEKYFYDLEKERSNSNFKIVYYIPELTRRLDLITEEVKSGKKVNKTKNDLLLLSNEINMQKELVPFVECKILSVLEPK